MVQKDGGRETILKELGHLPYTVSVSADKRPKVRRKEDKHLSTVDGALGDLQDTGARS